MCGADRVDLFADSHLRHYPRRWGPYAESADKSERHAVLVAPDDGDAWRWLRYPSNQVWAECATRLGRVITLEKRAMRLSGMILRGFVAKIVFFEIKRINA